MSDKEIEDLTEEFESKLENLYAGDFVSCPTCKSTHNIVCPECGNWADECDCVDALEGEPHEYYCGPCNEPFMFLNTSVFDEEDFEEWEDAMPKVPEKPECKCTPPNKYFCGECRVHRSAESDPWVRFEDPIPKKTTSTTTKSTSTTYGTGSYTYMKCRHYAVSVDLGNGVKMWPSSMNNERNKDGETQKKPDFGLYADYGWRATWRNEMINWPDYGIPKDLDIACEQIKDAYLLAKNNMMVEIGCIGGHGRTGTILACMYVYASWDSNDKDKLTPEEAVIKVHTDYCKEAIESKKQEWFIAYFSNKYFNTELPEEPKTTTTTYSTGTKQGTTCSLVQHVAMILRGHKTCHEYGSACTWWERDLKTTTEKKGEYSAQTEKSAMAILDKYPLREGGIKLDDEEKPEPDFASVCMQTDHYAMILRGWKKCRINDACGYWETDVEDWFTGKLFDEIAHSQMQSLLNVTPQPDGKTPHLDYFKVKKEQAEMLAKRVIEAAEAAAKEAK